MLEEIKALARLNALGSQAKGTKEFNATLPLLLKVLGKKGAGEYWLKLGNTTIETKSQKELIVGQKYWAQMSRSSVGAIVLSRLTPQPQMVETLQNSPLKFAFGDLEKLLGEKDSKDFLVAYKDFLLDKFVNAATRYEFLVVGNLLLSLQKNVLSLVIGDSSGDSFLQTRRGKSKKQSLEFYAIYPHLGALRGRVYRGEDGINAEIYVAYEGVKKVLESRLDLLKGFGGVSVYVVEALEPLFVFEESLLDIRG
ncbi:hypothetical protein [Helicobacter sp. 11S02596-1]|uniref:hypothetical protein n=1 Tax=Helicobacter sp. 11S02596-1 TaxID=1476194 RepID=UPI000BA78FAD|nr:hypothetical protein [Helicobacter sp. 11S02596-1]PAF43540.1 hypothetical protein BJI48_04595 [Helicobacter sp. 11S02596-1]